MRPGKQLFPLNYNNISGNKDIKHNIKAIKLIIKETFGGSRTYINQIMLYEQKAEKIKEFFSGNELNKIYKNNKQFIKNYSNEKNNKLVIKKNNSFNNAKIRTKISQRNNQKNLIMNHSNEPNLIQKSDQNHSKRKNNNKNKNNKNHTNNEKEEEIYTNNGEIMDFERSENCEEEIEVSSKYYNDNINDDNNDDKGIKEKKMKFEITPITKGKKASITDIKNNKNNKNKKEPLRINLNENLTPNKYLKRVKSLTNGNNKNFNFSTNIDFVLNNNDTQEYNTNLDNKIFNILQSSNEKNTIKNKVQNSNEYNNYMKIFQKGHLGVNDKDKIYDERMSNRISNYSNKFNTDSFDRKKILNDNYNNNINNIDNIEYEENQQISVISDNAKRITKNGNNIFEFSREISNDTKKEKIKNKPSFKFNNINISSQQYENQNIENEYEENYDDNYYINDKNEAETKKVKVLTSNNSQRLSVITNENAEYKKNKVKLIKEKLDYLEGNIIEIKKDLNLISEHFISSKEFFMNNFKKQILSICQEIYNENIKNENNNTFINNSYFGSGNKDINNEKLLENEINREIDEKLGNLENNICNKFLRPTINKFGNSIKKNMEEVKKQVDTIGSNIYFKKNNLEKEKSYFGKDEQEDDNMEFKTSSHLRNEKFDEIDRIGEKLYNKLVEKEKKLKISKQEKTRFLNEEKEKYNNEDNNSLFNMQ